MGDGVSFYDVSGSDRNAFIAGAEWARKEALREAADAVVALMAERDIYTTAAVSGVIRAQAAIRALAEGEPDA
jgi:hypothetical protein